MSWSALPVKPDVVPCERPYSFYFDLIEPYWRAGDTHTAPLHRLATLARKQGAKVVVLEDASGDASVAAELDCVDGRFGGGGEAEAIGLAFLSELPTDKDVGTVREEALIGACTLVNYRPPGESDFKLTWIHEAVFAKPKSPGGKTLLNNFVNTEGSFEVTVGGRTFPVEGICYAQQNGHTAVCAHATIRMVERTLFPERPASPTAKINALLGGPAPQEGLLSDEIARALEELTGCQVADIDCDERPPSEYVSILTAAADSGEIALLIFVTGADMEVRRGTGSPKPEPEADTTTGTDGAIASGEAKPGPSRGGESERQLHVVMVFGYTRNSDEWHPLAIPEYSVLPRSKYLPASMWVDHFIIHDDNFGPYLTLDTRALERDPTVPAEKILIVRRHPTTISADMAEAAASIWLSRLPDVLKEDPALPWLNMATRYKGAFVLRPVLLSRDEYVAHLNGIEGHDGSRLEPKLTDELAGLPEVVWMVEVSLPDLFTGNRSKLGEVVIDANVPNDRPLDATVVVSARFPGRLVIAERVAATDPAQGYKGGVADVTLTSHTQIYLRKPPEELW